MFNNLMILLADAAGSGTPPAGATPQGGGGIFDSSFIYFVALPAMVLAYILFMRPMQKQEREKAALLTSTKKNDKVITHSGIYGTVVSVSEKEDEIVVRVDDNVRLKMIKNSILRNLTNEEAAKEAKAAKGAKDSKPAAAPASTAVTTKEGGA